MNPAINGMNAAKLQQLRAAMVGFSSIQKLSGLNSAVNTLKKIPDVINGLDTGNLDKLERQMERLAKAIAPLATELDKIGTSFSKLPARVTQVVTATNKMAKASEKAAESTEKHSKALDTQGINIMAAIQNFESFVHVVTMVGDALHATLADAMEWDGIQYRFGRAFGEDAEEVYEYVQKVNDVLGINIQQFMQYSSLYGSLLSGFGMAQEKVTTISVGLTELSYDIWAAYNDRFKTLEDASEAVRSAITGEIEPIRNAGIALTEASLQEYMNSVGMAHISIEKLSEAQKAEVRYAAMMNAAMQQGIVGTYASEMQTAEGAVRNLSQAFKALKQAFGSLFIPILQIAIPYLTAFVNILREAIAAIADFFGITFMEIDWGNGADFSAGKESSEKINENFEGAAAAAKKARDYTMGFDELNVIQPPTETGGSGGGGGSGEDSGWGDGLDLDTLWDESVFAKASKQVDELKQKILDFFEEWKTEIAIVAAALGALSVASLLDSLGEALHLGDKFLGTMDTIKKLAATAIVITLQYSFVHERLEEFIEEGSWQDYISALVATAIGSGVLYSQWGKTGLAVGLAVTAVASLKVTFEDGDVDSTEEVVTGPTGFATAAGALALVWPKVKPFFDGIVEFFNAAKQMAPEVGWLAALFPKLSTAFAALGGWISTAATAVGSFLAGITAPAWVLIVVVITAIVSVVYFLVKRWKEVKQAVVDFWKTNIVPKLQDLKESWDKIVTAVTDAKNALVNAIPPGVREKLENAAKWVGDIAKRFAEWVKSVEWLKAIGKAIEWVGAVIFSVLGGVVAGVISSIISWFEGLVQSISGVIQIFSGFVEFIIALFTGGDIMEPIQKMIEGIKDFFVGLWDMVTGPLRGFVDGVIDFFTELWDELVGHSIVPDTIDSIVEWFLSLPDKILDPIKKFTDDVITKFKNLWSRIKTWYTTNVAPKFTKDYWAGVFIGIYNGLKEKLDEAWEKIKDFFDITEWKKKVTDVIDTIKENFKIPEFPKIKLEVEYSTDVGKVKRLVYEALGLPGWPSLKWSTYATGGFPSTGEAFIARENGIPEMVGRIGNRATVANNDQIVEAVSRGVYSAVVAAMSAGGNGNGQNVNVYLDGKQIYASVKRVEAERGVSVMGNQLSYGY